MHIPNELSLPQQTGKERNDRIVAYVTNVASIRIQERKTKETSIYISNIYGDMI